MNRPTFAALFAALGLAASASAEPLPMPTWGYDVRTVVAPAQVLGAATGLATTDTVVFDKALKRPLTPPVNLPDAATWLWDDHEVTLTDTLLVKFTDEASGGRTFDYANWSVTWEWEKVSTADGPAWEFVGETDRLFAWFGDNYIGGQRANRYDVAVDADGTVRLSMTPDVENLRFVPEPGTVLLAGVGLAGLAGGFRRRHLLRLARG